jgi:archaemetzincin
MEREQINISRVKSFFVDLEISYVDFFEKLAVQLENVFHASVNIGEGLCLPDEAFDSERNQYNSSVILKTIKRQPPRADKTLAVTERDLYVEGLNFVFGEADVRSGICIVSLARLRQSFYGLPDNPALFFDRALKEAVHELGHLYRYPHCPNPECVMHFSNSLTDTDRKSSNFCGRCREWKQIEIG